MGESCPRSRVHAQHNSQPWLRFFHTAPPRLIGAKYYTIIIHSFINTLEWMVFFPEIAWICDAALQAATILVAMASGKNFWRPKFW